MNNILQQVILDNTVKNYLIWFSAILVVVLIKRFLSKYIAGLLFRLIKRASWNIEKKAFVDLLLGPLEGFLVIFVTLLSLDRLKFPSVMDFYVHRISFKQIVDSLGAAVMVIAFTWLLLRIIDFISMLLEQKANLTPQLTDNQMVVFFRDFFKVLIVIVGLLLLIKFSFNKNIGTLLAGLSIVGAAIALAARESLENLIASFIIFFDKPFYVGDVVKVQGITGTIEKIGLRSTRVRTDQKTFVTVPNKQMVDSVMDNLSLRTQRRADLRLEISLNTQQSTIQELIEGIRHITAHPSIENRNVFFIDIIPNAFVITVEYYTGVISIQEFNQLKQVINLEILKLMDKLQVELSGLNTDIRIVNSGVQI